MMTRSCRIRRGVTGRAHTTWWSWRFLGAWTACCTIFALEGCELAVGIGMIGAAVQEHKDYGRNELLIEDEITKALMDYKSNAPKIRIGDSQDAVLLLLPRQRKYGERPSTFNSSMSDFWAWQVRRILAKPPRFYFDNGSLIQIYYFRSSRIRDDRVTDDEFTPYIFRDGVLTSIGWRVLGGPNSFSSAPHP
ncbi:MAG: hypothetical protein A4E19_17225 [Nitrospira sp. SG-bin1]|nr:MAG: hypothetical protein A4E19_17225 [Nitrospira sp. SG-bin1]